MTEWKWRKEMEQKCTIQIVTKSGGTEGQSMMDEINGE